MWLDFEQRGYPDKLNFDTLGSCRQYAYRSLPAKKVYTPSLPELEASKRAHEAMLENLQVPSVTGTSENYLVAGATAQVLGAMNTLVTNARTAYVNSAKAYATMRGALHRWAVDKLIAIELGSVAEGIFDASRAEVDAFVSAHCAKAAEQLLVVEERMRDRSAESFALALTSCRRLIASVADAVFAARAAFVDSKGTKRLVGEAQYKNRLIAFLDDRIQSSGTRAIVSSQLEHLAARLDAVYEKACKGVSRGG